MYDDIEFLKISVVGLGYIGLPTAAMFATRKIEVVGVDVNSCTVDTINRGEIHIVEPDLDMLVHAAVTEGYLRATTTPESSQAFLIAVPTPFKGENHEPDLSYIRSAVEAIAPVLEPGNLIVIESTTPVGTAEQLAVWLAEARADLSFPQQAGEASDIRIAHCPERVLPGKVMQELITNDRVIGGMTPACSALATRLYKVFVTGDCVIASNPSVAEMAKLTENGFRDVNIAFANELSIICGKLGIDVWELIRLANQHPRVNVLQPGPGVGGHCIAVDPWFIVGSAPEQARLIRAAREVNDAKPAWVIDKVRAEIDALMASGSGRQTDDVAIACYGLTYKSDTDDLRESPSLEIVARLAARHPGPILVVEPNIAAVPQEAGRAELVDFEGAAWADIHLMLVDHAPFRARAMPGGRVVDTRGVWKQSSATH